MQIQIACSIIPILLTRWFRFEVEGEDIPVVADMGSIARKWRQLSGQDYWANMVEPLDIDLRRYIIHYGEMAQATYDAFNSDTGNSQFGKKNFFAKVGLEKGNPFKYSVTKFLYATSEIDGLQAIFISPSLSREGCRKESNWMGYVAVATDEGKTVLGRRDIVIAWRGTVQPFEWAEDVQIPQTSAPQIFGGNADYPEIHKGFHSIYTSNDATSPFDKTSARDQVLKEIRRLVEEFKNEEISITVTGHSLGAAVATLNAVDIVANGFNKPKDQPEKACLVTAIVFACPRVGDSNFKEVFSSYSKDLRALRIINEFDIVPKVPLGYSTVGEELEIDTQKSKYLKRPGNLKSWHNLEIYLHGVAGTQGSKGEFKLAVKRDIALVNKGTDALEDEYRVPEKWRTKGMKGMVKRPDGSWKIMDIMKINFHSYKLDCRVFLYAFEIVVLLSRFVCCFVCSYICNMRCDKI